MSTTEVEVVDDYETVARVALMIADAAETLSTVLAGVADMLAGSSHVPIPSQIKVRT